jgi:hypothetical protein
VVGYPLFVILIYGIIFEVKSLPDLEDEKTEEELKMIYGSTDIEFITKNAWTVTK